MAQPLVSQASWALLHYMYAQGPREQELFGAVAAQMPYRQVPTQRAEERHALAPAAPANGALAVAGCQPIVVLGEHVPSAVPVAARALEAEGAAWRAEMQPWRQLVH
jgi:hypothetical protein